MVRLYLIELSLNRRLVYFFRLTHFQLCCVSTICVCVRLYVCVCTHCTGYFVYDILNSSPALQLSLNASVSVHIIKHVVYVFSLVYLVYLQLCLIFLLFTLLKYFVYLLYMLILFLYIREKYFIYLFY